MLLGSLSLRTAWIGAVCALICLAPAARANGGLESARPSSERAPPAIQNAYDRLPGDFRLNAGGTCYLRANVWAALLRPQFTEASVGKFLVLFTDAFHPESWAYHIVPAVSDRRGLYILEKANGFKKPLEVGEWFQKLTGHDLSQCGPLSLADPTFAAGFVEGGPGDGYSGIGWRRPHEARFPCYAGAVPEGLGGPAGDLMQCYLRDNCWIGPTPREVVYNDCLQLYGLDESNPGHPTRLSRTGYWVGRWEPATPEQASRIHSKCDALLSRVSD